MKEEEEAGVEGGGDGLLCWTQPFAISSITEFVYVCTHLVIHVDMLFIMIYILFPL